MGGDWVWYLCAAGAGLSGLCLFWWSLWGDRAHGRARCGGCWYSLAGVLVGEGSGTVCPECGWKAVRGRSLYRSRRRWWGVFLAVLLGVGALASGLTPRVRRDGAWSVVPTWVMWGLVRSGRVPDEGFVVELGRRSADSQSKSAELFYSSVPSVRLTRERWVKGVPVRARAVASPVPPPMAVASFVYSQEGRGVNDADVVSAQSHENWWTPSVRVWTQSGGAGTGGQSDFTGDVACQFAPPGLLAKNVVFSVKIPLEQSIDQVMTPVVLDKASLLAAIRPSMFVLPTTSSIALSIVDVSESEIGAGVAIGARAEIVCGGEVVARGRWYQGSGSAGMNGRPVLVRIAGHDPANNANGPFDRTLEELVANGCVVRFSTDVEMALSALGYGKYWKGSFEVPLNELVGR